MKISLTRLCGLAIVAFIFTTPVLSASTEEIITAFKSDPIVKQEINNLSNKFGSNHEDIHVVDIGGGCGVAGCSFTTLVIMKLARLGTNPQTTSILATVEGFNGQIGKITLVEVKPKNK